MNDAERIRKLLEHNKTGQSGWRKVLATASGSYSKSLALKNLSRLAAARIELLSQLQTTDLPK